MGLERSQDRVKRVSSSLLLDSFAIQMKIHGNEVEQTCEQLQVERVHLCTEIRVLNKRILEIEGIAQDLQAILQKLGEQVRETERENQELRSVVQRYTVAGAV